MPHDHVTTARPLRQPQDNVPQTKSARDGLLEAGVDPARIRLVNDEQEAVDTALGLARAGDLVMIFGDSIKRCWKQIVYFKPGEGAGMEIEAPPGEEPFALEREEEAWQHESDVELVRDGRGVIIAAEPEDSD